MPKPTMNRRPQGKRPQRHLDLQPSRSAKKRESLALQKLGEDLAALNPQARSELQLPEELQEALTEYDKIKDREGRRRHRQFIGKLMREVDAPAIARALATRGGKSTRQAEWLVAAKNYMELMLNAPQKDLTKIIRRFLGLTIPGMLGESQPEALQHIRELALMARNEKGHAAETASRELYEALAALLPT